MEILKSYSTEIISVVSLIIGVVVSLLVPKVKTLLALIKSKLGDANYNECKKFIENLVELDKSYFTEANVVSLLELLNKKYGDYLSGNTIKSIVETVAGIVIADVAKEVVK